MDFFISSVSFYNKSKILSKKKSKLYEERVNPIKEKIQEKIPERVKGTLEEAFYKGFNLVLSKGRKYIEKLYDKEKIQTEHDIMNYAVEKSTTKKNIKKLDGLSKKSTFFNKTIYEIAISYGFDYGKEEEQVYIL